MGAMTGLRAVPPRPRTHRKHHVTTAQPLDPSATIGKAFAIYKEHAAVLLPLAFGLFAIQAIVSYALRGSVTGALIGAIVTAIVGIVFQGSVVELARDVEDGTLDSSPGQLITAIGPVILPLFLVGLLGGLMIGIGFVFLIVPGLFLATIFAVVGPVTVLERPGVIAAFGRSKALVAGSGWPVFGLILFNFVITFAVGIVAGIIGAIGGDAGGALLTWIASAIVAPATALVIAVAYLRLRELNGEAPLPTGVATPGGAQGIGGQSGMPGQSIPGDAWGQPTQQQPPASGPDFRK